MHDRGDKLLTVRDFSRTNWLNTKSLVTFHCTDTFHTSHSTDTVSSTTLGPVRNGAPAWPGRRQRDTELGRNSSSGRGRGRTGAGGAGVAAKGGVRAAPAGLSAAEVHLHAVLACCGGRGISWTSRHTDGKVFWGVTLYAHSRPDTPWVGFRTLRASHVSPDKVKRHCYSPAARTWGANFAQMSPFYSTMDHRQLGWQIGPILLLKHGLRWLWNCVSRFSVK